MKNYFNKIIEDERVKTGLKFLKEDHENTLIEQKEICAISAPSFQEERRGKDYLKRFQDLGLEDIHMDEVGNVLGKISGTQNGPKLVVAAHLDTVFPEETDTTVKEKDGYLYAPAIGDDTRGLAEILSIIRAFRETGIEPIGDVVFCGNVCEEGLGDLRGVKHLFQNKKDIDGFMSIDGTGVGTIIHEATGSHRYKITYKGSGGHSFKDFGMPSAIHALGRAIAKIGDLKVPDDPKTTFTVGTVEGGTSVNAIAGEATMYVDMRSNSEEELLKLEKDCLKIVKDAVEEENNRWKHEEKIKVDIELLGNRPAGSQSEKEPIVEATVEAIKAIGLVPKIKGAASSDANIPISLGIPAIAVGRGGMSGEVHTLKEWFDPKDAYYGPQKTFLAIVGLVGIKNLSEPLLKKRSE
ncbi:M20/M25/M40 family metallo-hydrolase [Crassaminicella profunda]|uniref:M20/M25/M40 family metallo-hydrolase n=1 Tax=Crassaminicella profunda TaxID=1286698 RepID=UPI001FE5FEC6|nr:M20/M25/M40 family metallo-hydrolase [Crassaminicella profunda]